MGVKKWLTAWIKANKNMYNKFAYRLNKLDDVKKTDWKRFQNLGETQEAEQFILAVVEGAQLLAPSSRRRPRRAKTTRRLAPGFPIEKLRKKRAKASWRR